MKAKLKNLLTGKIIDVYSTTDSVDSSYGLECWVDKKGNSYGQCQFGAPLGFELVECDTPTDQFINPGFIKDYFSKLGKKGGSSRTPKKSASSAANLDRARAEGKTGGYPLGRSRRSREEKEKLLLEKCRRHHLEEMGIGGTLTRRNISEISDSDIDRIYNNIITEIANEPTTRFNPADYLDPEGPIKIYLYDKLFARYSKKGEKFPASDMAKNLAIELMAGCTGRYNVITIGRMEYRLESEK